MRSVDNDKGAISDISYVYFFFFFFFLYNPPSSQTQFYCERFLLTGRERLSVAWVGFSFIALSLSPPSTWTRRMKHEHQGMAADQDVAKGTPNWSLPSMAFAYCIYVA